MTRAADIEQVTYTLNNIIEEESISLYWQQQWKIKEIKELKKNNNIIIMTITSREFCITSRMTVY